MRARRLHLVFITILTSVAATSVAAHVSVTGPATAGAREVLTFGIGHGCEGADSYGLEIDIPAGVMSVRAMPSAWGEATLTKNEAGDVTKVSWSKDTVRDEDDAYYRFQIRAAMPEAPFTTLYFVATQHCRTPEGVESTVVWGALPGDPGEEEPAAPLLLLPPRMAGWNQFTVPSALTDLSVFDDAQIVWSGDAAYSKSATTMALIESDPDVATLTEIEAGAEIWVKY